MRRATRADLLAAPVIVAAVAWAALIAWFAVGPHLLWPFEPRNVSEAAAGRDGAAIVRMVRAGADLNSPAVVRPGLISSTPVRLAPIVAAAAARREEIVQLLIEFGARVDADTWNEAWCISDASDVRARLEPVRPDGALADCPVVENDAD